MFVVRELKKGSIGFLVGKREQLKGLFFLHFGVWECKGMGTNEWAFVFCD